MRMSVLLMALIAPLAALGQGEPGLPDVVNARSLGMGSAYRGTGLSTDIVWGNPAMMSVSRRYQADLSGTWDWGNRFAYAGVGVVDSQTSRLAAGVGYNLVALGKGDTRRTANVNTMAFALPILDALHVGVAGRHLLMSGAGTANAITLDAGLVLKLGDSFALGVTGNNLIDTNHPELARYYTASLGFVGGLFSFGGDVRADFNAPETRLVWSGGAEYVFGRGFPVRGGYSYDTLTGVHSLSVGLGFFAEGGGVDLAYRTDLNGQGHSLALTVRTLFPGTGQ